MLIATRSRAARTALASLALAGGILTTAGAEGALAAPAPVPCTSAGGGHYNCQFYVPGDGVGGGAPVQASDGRRVGYLHKGTNWVVCQQVGGRVDYGGYFNTVWAWTLTDGTPKWGWVNAVYASGGDNDGGFGGGVPSCAGAHGAPPGGSGAPPPPPGAAPPPPVQPPPAAKDPGPRVSPPKRCDDVREDQRATVRFKYTWEQFTYDKSQVPAKPFHERSRTTDVGTLKIGAATCRTGKSWRILKPVSLEHDARGIDVKPKLDVIGDRWVRGWGIGVNGAKLVRATPVIDVTMMRCTKGFLLAGIKELLGFPIPELKFKWALLPWLAAKLIPDDGVKCQEPARYGVELHVDKRGKLVVAAPMTGVRPLPGRDAHPRSGAAVDGRRAADQGGGGPHLLTAARGRA